MICARCWRNKARIDLRVLFITPPRASVFTGRRHHLTSGTLGCSRACSKACIIPRAANPMQRYELIILPAEYSPAGNAADCRS
ncbi:hypothetical protein KCP75_10070 [Salmonella enterica subsp. enterica]|nr:hypothetical protein KCP75_10070 [Salmonella enterica subsp. enterica]